MLQVSATDTGRIAQYETKNAAHVAKAEKKTRFGRARKEFDIEVKDRENSRRNYMLERKLCWK